MKFIAKLRFLFPILPLAFHPRNSLEQGFFIFIYILQPEIEVHEVLCSAACKFLVYILILSIRFDTEGRFIAQWNFILFQSRRFHGF